MSFATHTQCIRYVCVPVTDDLLRHGSLALDCLNPTHRGKRMLATSHGMKHLNKVSRFLLGGSLVSSSLTLLEFAQSKRLLTGQDKTYQNQGVDKEQGRGPVTGRDQTVDRPQYGLQKGMHTLHSLLHTDSTRRYTQKKMPRACRQACGPIAHAHCVQYSSAIAEYVRRLTACSALYTPPSTLVSPLTDTPSTSVVVDS
jgi:hypothetical protein